MKSIIAVIVLRVSSRKSNNSSAEPCLLQQMCTAAPYEHFWMSVYMHAALWCPLLFSRHNYWPAALRNASKWSKHRFPFLPWAPTLTWRLVKHRSGWQDILHLSIVTSFLTILQVCLLYSGYQSMLPSLSVIYCVTFKNSLNHSNWQLCLYCHSAIITEDKIVYKRKGKDPRGKFFMFLLSLCVMCLLCKAVRRLHLKAVLTSMIFFINSSLVFI